MMDLAFIVKGASNLSKAESKKKGAGQDKDKGEAAPKKSQRAAGVSAMGEHSEQDDASTEVQSVGTSVRQ